MLMRSPFVTVRVWLAPGPIAETEVGTPPTFWMSRLPPVTAIVWLPVDVAVPLTVTLPALVNVALPTTFIARLNDPELLTFRSPAVVVPLRDETWLAPPRFVTPEVLVVSPAARMAPVWLSDAAVKVALPAALSPVTERASVLTNVRFPPVVVPLNDATWFGPVSVVFPAEVVVRLLARIWPLGPSLIVPPGCSACSSTLPVVRIAGLRTVLSEIDLSDVTLMLPPPGVLERML